MLLLIVALCVGACEASQPARTCNEVNGLVLRNIIKLPQSPQGAQRQIANGYGLAQEQVSMSSLGDETYLQWSKDNVDGNVRLGGTKPAGGGLYYKSRPPSVASVIDCLGSPDFYRAYYQRGGPEVSWNSLELHLYFVRQGVLAVAYVHGSGKEPPRLNMGLTMQAFGFAPVDTPEDTMAHLNENYSAEFLQQIRPWPGKLEDVIVEIDPGLTQ